MEKDDLIRSLSFLEKSDMREQKGLLKRCIRKEWSCKCFIYDTIIEFLLMSYCMRHLKISHFIILTIKEFQGSRGLLPRNKNVER